MRSEFYEVYRDLAEAYRASVRSAPGLRALRAVDDAMTETIDRLDLSRVVRPDAMLFLLVNMHQMLALPLEHPNALRLERASLAEIARSDLRAILESSLKEAKNGEISAHRVIDSVSRGWRELRTARIDVWG